MMNELAQGPPVAADRKLKAVFTIIENHSQGGSRKYFLRVGVGFVNGDGSMNVRLDAMPVNGMLHIRDMPQNGDSRARRHDETTLFTKAST